MDADSYDVILELLSQSHQFGESIADSIELWISVSFAVNGAAYFAPDRMHVAIASFLLAIYLAFTAHTFASTNADMKASLAAIADAKRIASESNVELSLLTLRASGNPEDTQGSPTASRIFIFGLFFGVIGFVGFTSYRLHTRTPVEHDD